MALPAQEPFTGATANLADPPWHKTTAFGVDRLVKKDGSGHGTPVDTNLDDLAYWDNDTFANDQYSQFVARFTGPGDGTQYLYLLSRHTGGELSTCNNYRLESDGGSDTSLYKTITGVTTALGTANSTTWTSGDVLKLTCTGTTISVAKNGSTIITATDSAVTAGVGGMGGSGATGILFDDWEGGNVALAQDHMDSGQQSEIGTCI